ncbi:MarR family winged helix-turn-helix transcriptional regulator [Pectinatus haikarae]|uniref:MarR family winged helix-turn-helix transcriptional regulator n=1 Tax=Pectinatus haikarae TaxID=349096 RepID=UPI0018C5CD80|nr:MarR family transcriptional regulator [Pectinatus haikarae]
MLYEIDTIGFFISRAQANLRKRFLKNLRSYDITPEEWVLFVRLSEEVGISLTDLSKTSLRDKPYTSRLIDKMEKKGLIRKEESQNDKRSSLIYLTEKGAISREEINLVIIELNRWEMEVFSKKEIEELKFLLNKLYEHVKF